MFPYSRRSGTRADAMPDQLKRAVKEERAKYLIEAGEQLRQDYEERLIGSVCSILAEECCTVKAGSAGEDARKDRILIAGYTPEYVRILADPASLPGEDVMDKFSGENNMTEKARGMINKTVNVVPEAFVNGTLMA